MTDPKPSSADEPSYYAMPNAGTGASWCVQWIADASTTGQEYPAEGIYFHTEADARAYLATDAKDWCGPYVRLELQFRPPWQTVETMPYPVRVTTT